MTNESNKQKLDQFILADTDVLAIRGADAHLKNLSAIDRAFLRLEENQKEAPFSDIILSHYAASLLSLLIVLIKDAEEAGLTRQQIREYLPNTWRIHSQSSFISHVQRWPRGYAGDFEAVNTIVDRIEKSPSNTLEGALGRIALGSLIAQQHREKLLIQAREVSRTCEIFENPKILSIACGPSRDIEGIQFQLHHSNAELWLVDFDAEALQDSKKRLSQINERVKFIHADVQNLQDLFQSLNSSQGFHLIYAGGLFDYLTDEFIQFFLSQISPLVIEGGSLMFTNIKTNNPYKAWIENMAKWRLKERDESMMRQLLEGIGFSENQLYLDPTGLTWIAKAIR